MDKARIVMEVFFRLISHRGELLKEHCRYKAEASLKIEVSELKDIFGRLMIAEKDLKNSLHK